MTLNFPASPSDGDTYDSFVYDGTKGAWKLVTIAGNDLTDLNDVTITTPTDGQSLFYDGTDWTNQESLHPVSVSTPVTGDTLVYDGTKWVNESEATLLGKIYPVGSIYINATDSTNPGTLLGFGTWAEFGAGRVPVGFNAGESEFNAAQKTGGAKTHTLTTAQIPSHTHTQNSHTHDLEFLHQSPIPNSFEFGTGSTAASGRVRIPAGGEITPNERPTGPAGTRAGLGRTSLSRTATNQNTGGGGAHNNLQPYITVYMWRRTA